MKSVCPLHCDQARDGVDWAGLPVNLDLAFSQNQLDKVYAQYLMRRRKPILKRRSPDVELVCACEMADSAN